MKRKIGWIAAVALLLAAAFVLGVTGVVSLAAGTGASRGRTCYRASTVSEDEWCLLLSDVEYGNDECRAALSGTLALRGTGEAEMVPVEVPEQRVTFREMMNDEWYAWITVGDGERIALHARRQKTASADGKAAYGEIVCLWTENVDVTYWYAGEEGGEWEKEDRLVGCLVTFAPLWDCLEEGALLADDVGGLVNAELRSFSEVDEDGELREWKEYVFPGVRGFRLFECLINDAGFIYGSSMIDDPFFDVHTGINLSDLGKKVTLEGTLTFQPRDDLVLYMNPVYQREDGRVYADPGNGIGTQYMKPGGTGSQRMNGSSEHKVNGETVREDACEVTVRFGAALLPVRYTVVQMDAEHRCLAARSYPGTAVPETLAILPETAYVVLEKEYAEDGGPTLTREIVSREDGGFTLTVPRDDGILCSRVFVGFAPED